MMEKTASLAGQAGGAAGQHSRFAALCSLARLPLILGRGGRGLSTNDNKKLISAGISQNRQHDWQHLFSEGNMENRVLKARAAMSASVLALLVGLGAATPAMAAAATAAEKDSDAITVTARKSKEDILKVPVTVSAMSAEQLEARGVKTITDAITASPGINVNNSSSGHADRSFQQIILRGFTPVTTLATTTSMFIDGVPVASPSALTSISDPAQIEVLKGPQSAYFGRNTFAGAVNVSNREPSGKWGTEFGGSVATHGTWSLKGSIDGSIVGDKLTFRLTGSQNTKAGSWVNSDGTTLGDQSSKTGSLLIVAKPTDRLTIKLFGMLSTDDDGASAQTRILAANIYSYTGNVLYASQSNCTVAGHPWICGTLPSQGNPVSSNTAITPAKLALLNSTRAGFLKADDQVQHYGLLRHTQHAHGVIDYKFSDHISAEVLAGYNHETWSNLIDLDGFDSTNERGYNSSFTAFSPTASNYDFPYVVDQKNRDYSLEGRLSYKYGRLHGVLGTSYLEAQSQQSLGALSTTAYAQGGVNKSKTFGVYFGAIYDITDKLTASVEGRYQIDTMASYVGSSPYTSPTGGYLAAGTYAANSLLGQKSFKNFAPRAIVNYQFSPALMVYASYALGVNPSTFNNGIITQAAFVQTQAQALGVPLFAKPEKVKNYEVGAKGKAFGGALRYSLAAYYAQWTDQVNALTFTATDPAAAPGTSPGLYTGYNNTGAVDLYGVEGQATYKLSDLVTVDAAAAYTGSRIISFTSSTLTSLYGTSNFYGKEMPNMSKYSANVGITFGGNVKQLTDAKWFLRTDWNFKSGMWVDQANVTKSADLHLFNARLGLKQGPVSASVFVNNLFNNHTYTSVANNWAIEPTFANFARYSAVQVGLPDLRTIGFEMKVKI
jgi:iron complex outermembrane receptor protein